jgi:hypothetical protein
VSIAHIKDIDYERKAVFLQHQAPAFADIAVCNSVAIAGRDIHWWI